MEQKRDSLLRFGWVDGLGSDGKVPPFPSRRDGWIEHRTYGRSFWIRNGLDRADRGTESSPAVAAEGISNPHNDHWVP